MGAHTEYGQYVIDWRKTKHFNVPDTTDFAVSMRLRCIPGRVGLTLLKL